MVENFTKTKVDAYVLKNQDQAKSHDEIFEIKLKSSLQNLSKNPNKTTIDSILAYSKSLKSK